MPFNETEIKVLNIKNAGLHGRVFVEMIILDRATGNEYFQRDVFQLGKPVAEADAQVYVEREAKRYAENYKNKVRSAKNPNPDTVLKSVRIT